MATLRQLIDFILSFQHNSKLAKNEPSWGSVSKGKLPRVAFAEHGEAGKKSTWGFPHHWIQGGGKPDDEGVFTTGTMFLHKGGLHAAWAAANGARSGKTASSAVKAHLRKHMAAIGEGKKKTAELAGITESQLEEMDKAFIKACLLCEEDLVVKPQDMISEHIDRG